MGKDTPLTDLFWCPICDFRGLFKAEPVPYGKCVCSSWWEIGDDDCYLSLGHEEKEGLAIWNLNLFKE